MKDNFVYTIQLQIPVGYDIPATMENIKRFFESGGTEGKEVVKACLPVDAIIPERFVASEVEALKERICQQLIDPIKWHHKPLHILIRTEQAYGNGECLFELDENRKLIT